MKPIFFQHGDIFYNLNDIAIIEQGYGNFKLTFGSKRLVDGRYENFSITITHNEFISKVKPNIAFTM